MTNATPYTHVQSGSIVFELDELFTNMRTFMVFYHSLERDTQYFDYMPHAFIAHAQEGNWHRAEMYARDLGVRLL